MGKLILFLCLVLISAAQAARIFSPESTALLETKGTSDTDHPSHKGKGKGKGGGHHTGDPAAATLRMAQQHEAEIAKEQQDLHRQALQVAKDTQLESVRTQKIARTTEKTAQFGGPLHTHGKKGGKSSGGDSHHVVQAIVYEMDDVKGKHKGKKTQNRNHANGKLKGYSTDDDIEDCLQCINGTVGVCVSSKFICWPNLPDLSCPPNTRPCDSEGVATPPYPLPSVSPSPSPTSASPSGTRSHTPRHSHSRKKTPSETPSNTPSASRQPCFQCTGASATAGWVCASDEGVCYPPDRGECPSQTRNCTGLLVLAGAPALDE